MPPRAARTPKVSAESRALWQAQFNRWFREEDTNNIGTVLQELRLDCFQFPPHLPRSGTTLPSAYLALWQSFVNQAYGVERRFKCKGCRRACLGFPGDGAAYFFRTERLGDVPYWLKYHPQCFQCVDNEKYGCCHTTHVPQVGECSFQYQHCQWSLPNGVAMTEEIRNQLPDVRSPNTFPQDRAIEGYLLEDVVNHWRTTREEEEDLLQEHLVREYRAAPDETSADAIARRFFTYQRLDHFRTGVENLVVELQMGIRAALITGQAFDNQHAVFVRRMQGLLQRMGTFHLDDVATGSLHSPRRQSRFERRGPLGANFGFCMFGFLRWSRAQAAVYISLSRSCSAQTWQPLRGSGGQG
ncbi:hypothetical protein IE53DRAFT_371862 [Violaceomyces palustris]|uniref:Uncharacterized protein n=1 Tax=Violaceomyces palustris TaxID=1673888 RepID=A0ACD0NMA3_9BASI|nr:hypothetical protein IE53DRAFT_371862 [Violaceomyces palustris]